MIPRPHRSLTLALILLVALLTLSACATPTPTVSVDPTIGESATPEGIATLPPTAEPTDSPGRILLVVPAGVQPAENVREVLQALAAERGLAFETRPAIQSTDLTPADPLVVLVEPAEDPSNLAAAVPGTQFLAVSTPYLEGHDNLSVIRVDRAQLAFLGGYIAQMIAPDFRGGGLFPAASPELADAFTNGGHYLCGRCVPVFAPVVFFPQAAGADSTGWLAAYDELQKNRLETLYLSAEATQPDVMQAAASAGIVLLGETYPGDEYRSAWAVTLYPDVQQAVGRTSGELLNGETSPGFTAFAPIVLTDLNENWLTPGKQTQIYTLIDDLANGWVYPLSVPSE
jgi:hypothetical protein